MAGQVQRAVNLARQGLEQGERAPLFLTLRARWLEANDRPLDAAADLEEALLATPGDPALLSTLSRVLNAAGRYVRAAAAAQTALEADATAVEAHFQLGFSLEQQGELDAARGVYEEAARLDPAEPDALARLAGLAARRGDWMAARSLAARAPDRAASRFALIMADLAQGKSAQAEASARQIAVVPGLAPAIRAGALGFLADALDAQDRTDEAFAAYCEARALQRSLARGQFAETGGQFAARMEAEFAALPAWPGDETASSRSPIFVLGFPRSGTTLLTEILAGHPGAIVLDETPTLRDAILDSTGQSGGQSGGLSRLAAADPATLAAWRARYWQRAGADGDVVVDKGPFNTLHLPVIARLFPGARIVFALRDPRDAVFGSFRRQFAVTPYTYELLSLESAARFYDQTMRLGQIYRARLPLRILDLRNEDLVADPDGTVAKLCAFLGLQPTPAMTDFASRPHRAIASPNAARLAQGIRGQAAQWRRYAGHMAPVLPLLAPWVARFGYAP
ncbi:MAG TPA: sulfotransferase [Rhizomicrobium sp.]|jgi:tetratricopeptide (TPR) repeat protein